MNTLEKTLRIVDLSHLGDKDYESKLKEFRGYRPLYPMDDFIDTQIYGLKYLENYYNKENEDMISKIKVIFNPPATILYVGNKKYVSKAEKGETFDKEKGLMMCLIKAMGGNYTLLEKLMANAKDFTKEENSIDISTLG